PALAAFPTRRSSGLQGGAGILGGAPKSGKSFFALDLCVAVASQTPCAGRFAIPTKGRVTLLCAEDPHAVLVGRLRSLAASRGLRSEDHPPPLQPLPH